MKNNILSIRESKGISQVELGEQANISRWYMNKIENNKVHLGLVLASRIAYVLECSVQEIFFTMN